MHYLTQLTPAEVLMLTKGKRSYLREVNKLTFFHLMIRGALELQTQKKQSRRGGIFTLEYVRPGPAYETYPAKPHELVILDIFREERKRNGLLFRYFIRELFGLTLTTEKCMRRVARSKDVQAYLAYPWPAKYLNGCLWLSSAGKECRSALEQEIKQAKDRFENTLENERSKAMEMALALGGNLFLLRSFDSKLGLLFDQEMTQATTDLVQSFFNALQESSNSDWGAFSDSFDSGYSHAESSWGSDSGCGSGCGDSGCSGCGSSD